MLGLVLTAGGARGAYQAGVLKRIGELAGLRSGPSPFPIVTGASAGAINGSLVAARSAALRATRRASSRALVRASASSASSGPTLDARARRGRRSRATSLLGGAARPHASRARCSTPRRSRRCSREHFPPRGIADAIRRGHLYAVAISATSYHSGRSFTFVQGRPAIRSGRKQPARGAAGDAHARHVLASSAIPIVFPPVQVACAEGELWFGDGALRLVTPFSPAIRLGATHLLGVGVRSSQRGGRRSRRRSASGARAGAGLACAAARAGLRRLPERDLPRPPRRRPRSPAAHERARGRARRLRGRARARADARRRRRS